MTSKRNRQWLFASRPRGMVSPANFELRESEVPTPKEGQVLVRNLYLSMDPAMRAWMWERETYIAPLKIGDVMRGSAVGQIVASNKPGFEVGEFVVGAFGWQEYAVSSGGGPMPMVKIPTGIPLTATLGVLGMTGLTAYFGLLDLAHPRPGQTVVVSGAAGAVGSIAGQIAKLKGCRTIGIAGGSEKCRWCVDKAQFDACIDYKSENVRSRLKELCPDRINVYFDNVGGEILEAAMERLALKARVVICGAISHYNAEGGPVGPRNYMNLLVQRARMEGFVVFDYQDRFQEALAELASWVAQGQIRYEEDIVDGFENAPAALVRLFEGRNLGKQILRIAEAE